jgi:ATP-dependent helicase/DNAse subunit B
MAVRLVIGRAGTGKTAMCAREIRAAMAEDPLGPALLWITPEQGTFAAERQLLVEDPAPGGRGSFRAQVLSLRRLALMIARETGILAEAGGTTGGGGGGGGKPLDETARVVLLEEMVRQERPRLTVFASVADRPGFIKKLEATLRELRQHGHSGASLRTLADTRAGAAGGAGGMDAVMRRKLLDLAVLLEAWSKVVERPEAWDFEYVMHQAALAMGRAPLLAGARVWVDAISALTALELRMLAGLGLHAREVTITLLADPETPAIREMRGSLPGESASVGLFARTERLYLRLLDEFRRHGVAMGETVALREARRFADPAVQRVEAELLEPDRAQAQPPTATVPEGGGGGTASRSGNRAIPKPKCGWWRRRFAK